MEKTELWSTEINTKQLNWTWCQDGVVKILAVVKWGIKISCCDTICFEKSILYRVVCFKHNIKRRVEVSRRAQTCLITGPRGVNDVGDFRQQRLKLEKKKKTTLEESVGEFYGYVWNHITSYLRIWKINLWKTFYLSDRRMDLDLDVMSWLQLSIVSSKIRFQRLVNHQHFVSSGLLSHDCSFSQKCDVLHCRIVSVDSR